MNKYSNQICETMEVRNNESLQSIIDVQTNMLVELDDRMETLGKRLEPLRNATPSDPCPEPSVPSTSVVNNLIRENNLRIGRLISHVNLINRELDLS